MTKPPFQFGLKGLMLAVAIVAAHMLLLLPAPKPNTPLKELIGNFLIGRDGSAEVPDGAVRVGQDRHWTEIRASRIIVKKDGTTEVFGTGTILQGVR
jgi:hypothetical protein